MTKGTFLNLQIVLLMCLTTSVRPQPYAWENFTSKKQITSLEAAADYAWVTTTGGVAQVDLQTNTVRSYINSDGLGSIAVSFAAYAEPGQIYFGSSDGYLSALDLETKSFSLYHLRERDGQPLKLTAADTSGAFLWIATEVGIVKFDRFRHGGEVKETYRTLGVFPPETAVFDVLVVGDRLFAATGRGIVAAAHASEFLLDPNEWDNTASGDSGLVADSVYRLDFFAGLLFAGTDNGLFRLGGDGSFIQYDEVAGWRILDLAVADDRLLLLADTLITVGDTNPRTLSLRRLFSYLPFPADTILVELDEGALPGAANSVTFSTKLLIGTEESGVFVQPTPDADLEALPVPGPGSNDLVGGGVTQAGTIYAVARGRTYSWFSEGVWGDTLLNPDTRRTNVTAIVDKQDNLWVGADGNGVFRVSPDHEATRFHRGNSALLGNNDDLDYVFVNAIHEDPEARLWFSTRRGDTNRVAVMFEPADSLWTYFNSSDGIIADESRAIAAGRGFLAVGDRDQGLTFIEYGRDPFDHSDDVPGIYGTTRRLPSRSVTALAVDRDNTLWVGTNLGLAYFDADIKFFFPVDLPDGVSNDIRAIEVDSRNNLWVGTSSGLAFVSFGETEKRAFNTSNSMLLSDDIRQLHFNDRTGRLLVFTAGGLSMLDYNLESSSSETKVYPYPNPFVIGDVVERPLQFKLNQRATVRIYNVAGELVREISRIDFNAGWDGTNDFGVLVASGVYIFELLADDGSRYRGKIFVLRK